MRRNFGIGRLFVEDVVFSNEVGSAGMQRACKERAHDKISQGMAVGVADEDVVEQDLGCNVEDVNGSERHLVYHYRAERIEEDLEGGEEGFTKD